MAGGGDVGPARTVELRESRSERGGDTGRELGVDEGSARPEVLVVEHVGRREHRRADDAASLRLGRHLFHAHLGEMRFVERVEHRGCDLEPAGEPVERRVLEVLGVAQPFAHRVPLARTHDDEADEATLATEDRVERPRAVADLGARKTGKDASGRVRQRPIDDLRDGLVHAELDELSGSGVFPLEQRTEHRERGGDRRGVVDQMAGRQQRRVLGDAGLEREPAARGEDGIGGNPIGVRTVETEGSQRRHHEMGVRGGELPSVERVVEASVGRDQRVGVIEQLVEPIAVLGLIEIEDHAELAGVAHPEGQ